MGHAAFERSKEDRRAYKAQLRKEEALWAQMASAVTVTLKEVDSSEGQRKPRRARRSRFSALASNLRTIDSKPMTKHTNTQEREITICTPAIDQISKGL